MKKKYLLHVLICITLVLVFSSTSDVSARETVTELNEKWNEKFEYPITPNSKEWKEYSFSECLLILNPSEEILKEQPTDEIVRLLIEYPYIHSSAAYESISQFYNFLSSKSSIYAEWEQREDAFASLIATYDNHEIDYNVLNSDEPSAMLDSGANTDLFINKTLRYYWDRLTDDEIQQYKIVVDKKRQLYTGVESEEIRKILLNSLDAVTEIYNDDKKDDDPKSVRQRSEGFVNAGTIVYIQRTDNPDYVGYYNGYYSKYNTSASCLMYYANDLNYNTIESLNYYISVYYPTFSYVSSATGKYNCHSYAWISTSSSNIYWLNYPDAFCNSTAVSYVNTNGSVQAGDKVVIYSYIDGVIKASHSVIVNYGTYYITPITVTSKLGTLGVYTTTLAEMMDMYNGIYYEVYR